MSSTLRSSSHSPSFTVSRRDVLKTTAGVSLVGILAACGLGNSKSTLTTSAFGGNTQDVFQKIAFTPYGDQENIKITQVTLQSADALSRMRSEKNNPQIDMYQFSGGQELAATDEGLTHTINNISNAVDVPKEFKSPKKDWIAIAVIPEGIVYNTDKIKQPPTSYKDFFKPEYQGHVAFPTITNGYGADFLVMVARTYGGGENNIDPGFTQLRKIADRATIFKAADEVPTLFSKGDIWIMPYDLSNAFRAKDAGLPVGFVFPKEGAPASIVTICIAKKSKHVDDAEGAINYILKPSVQAKIAENLFWTPVNTKTTLPKSIADRIPTGTEGLKRLTILDRTTINKNIGAWTDQWNREIAG